VLIEVGKVAGTPTAVLRTRAGKAVPLQAEFRRILAGADSGYCFEIVCPWRALGLRPSLGTTFGFDATLFDADDGLEAQVEAACRPAGWITCAAGSTG